MVALLRRPKHWQVPTKAKRRADFLRGDVAPCGAEDSGKCSRRSVRCDSRHTKAHKMGVKSKHNPRHFLLTLINKLKFTSGTILGQIIKPMGFWPKAAGNVYIILIPLNQVLKVFSCLL